MFRSPPLLPVVRHRRVAQPPGRGRSPRGWLLALAAFSFATFSFATCALTGSAVAQLPTIQLRALSQSFFAPGNEYDLRASVVSDGDQIDRIVSSHEGIRGKVVGKDPPPFASESTSDFGHFRIRVAADTPPGRHELRVGGRFGVSNARSIWVAPAADELPVEALPAAGQTVESAVEVQTGRLYFRHATPQRIDYFRVAVPENAPVTVRLICQAVDSRMIGRLVVLGGDRQSLGSAIGSRESDPNVTVASGNGGSLVLAVSDALFRGGDEFAYGLLVTCDASIGDDLDFSHNRLVRSVTVPDDAPPVDALAEESDSFTELSVPGMITGRFDSADDQDEFRIRLDKGQVVEIDVLSERLGRPTDPRLVIERQIAPAEESDPPTWNRVATADDSQAVGDGVLDLTSKDPWLQFRAPDAGLYRIVVADLDTGRHPPPLQRYRLSVRSPAAEWRVVAYPVFPHKDLAGSRPSGLLLRRGGSATLRVFAIRNGFSGPITIHAADLPPGVTATSVHMASNQSATDLIFSASMDVGDHTFPVHVKAVASRDDATQTRTAEFAEVIWQRDGQIPTTRCRLVDSLIASTTPLDVCPFGFPAAEPSEVTVKKGETGTIKLTVDRRDGAGSPIVVRAQNLPGGVKAGDVTVAADQSETEWSIEVTAAAAPGRYTFHGQAESKVKFARNPQALARATEYRDHLKKLRGDEARKADHAALDQAIAAADKQIEALTKQTAARDTTLYRPTPPITLVIP